MGTCSSCLGRRSSQSEDPETSRLLSDDPYRNRYGSQAQNVQRPVYQPDPESVKRERELLEGISHAMFDNMLDVFTTQPQPASLDSLQQSLPVPPYANGRATSGYESDDDDGDDDIGFDIIQKGNAGPIFTKTPKYGKVSRAVHEAIG